MLDELVLRPTLTFFLKLLFRVEVRGLENYRKAGDKVIIISNHQSYLDPMLLGVFIPEKPAFAMNVFQAEKWYFRWCHWIFSIYTLDPLKPMSMKSVIKDMKDGLKLVIFPEGRITTSGGIMKIYDGAQLIAEKTGATILPVRIDGAEYSKLSNLSKKVRQRWFPKIRMTILPPIPPLTSPPLAGGKEGGNLYDVMMQSAFVSSHYRQPLLSALIEAYFWHGGGHTVASDIARQPMNYRQLFTRAFILSGKLNLGDEKNIAVLLPNSLGVMVTFVALHMQGKVPCMLNFSSGAGNMVHACRIAQAKTVLTSRVFVERGKLEPLIAALEKECRVIYLEDIRKKVTFKDKLEGLWRAFAPHTELKDVIAFTQPNDPAVILYTSGSEGVPKGVALSHVNLLANIHQVCARIDLNPSDQIFNALPVFHSFGLMVGMVLPMVKGIRTFLYPTPLHYRVIPDLVYDTDSTIMLGTDTFYKGYAKYAHPYDFWNVRLAVAGAEKLQESTRRLYADTFCMPIFQGYGVTESSPVISVNTPMEHKEGTVGRPLPGIKCRLQPVPGLEKGGRLEVKGPNVMLGYLKADKPGVIQPQGEWYDTGDIVDIDEEGYITILGRAKRFAKIAGEMVSLQAVEDVATALLPDAAHAAVAIPDERKGEQIILYTESKDLTREQLQAQSKEQGLPELCLPRQVVYMESIPRLGNGKIDYMMLGKV